MPENEFVIQTENLTYRYEGADRDAVKGVSLSVRRGEFLAVLGRNGSGKSTLGKLLNALIAPTEGSVCVCGIRPDTEDNTFLIRQKCGMVFQNPDNQTVATIVEEDVAFGPENLGTAPEEIRARVDWALEKVGMTAFRRTAPSMLSGGQKQRVAIAGVIAMKPEIIVFDESTSMLDPAGRLEVMETAKALNREHGVTVVWITHFMDEAAQASRMIVVDDGEIRLDGAPRQVFSRVKEIQSYGLEAPDMTVLAAMLRERGLNVSGEILTVEEMEVELCRLRSSI
ncbi:MAG: energy-coupling factor transporter ATPase [Clostridia bacterium]|nr:energy-coupling factor transporter ATPase [Clostridia bacterium]